MGTTNERLRPLVLPLNIAMTTLATDGVTIAADGQVTAGHIIEDLARQKVFKLNDGRAIGMAGTLANFDAFKEWFCDPNAEVPALSEDFEAVVIDGSNRVTVYDDKCRPLSMPVPYAGGSGKEVALGAMLAGATPKEAVKIAIQRDVYSGGRIRTITVKAS